MKTKLLDKQFIGNFKINKIPSETSLINEMNLDGYWLSTAKMKKTD